MTNPVRALTAGDTVERRGVPAAASEQAEEDVDRYQSELDGTLSEMEALKEVCRGHA